LIANKRWLAAPALGVAAALAFLFWWAMGRPVAVVDAPHPKLRCVSYAPFQGGQTPADPALWVPPEQMDADLKLLARRFECVRTYSIAHGQDAIPRLAKDHGLSVVLGVWISRDPVRNAAEVKRAVELAKEFPDTVRAIIVGNEVLLRREIPAERLAAIIREVKAATALPVTYADVWEFWLQNAGLAQHVDFVTVHILPYWEDIPIDIDRAVPHVRDILAKVGAAFPGKKLFVGETGWPSAGRTRDGAVPSLVNQARFVREFVAFAEGRGLDYNLIEAFDQPWKRVQEGTVGGYWGLYDGARAAKFPFAGPVSELPGWGAYLGASIVLALMPILFAALRGRGLHVAGWLAYGAASGVAGIALVYQWRFVALSSITPRDWVLGGAGLILCAAIATRLLTAAAMGSGYRTGVRPRIAALRDLVEWVARPFARPPDGALILAFLQTAAVIAACAVSLALAVDPRYRDFPTAAFVVPALGFLALRGDGGHGPEETWMGRLLALACIVVAVREGPENTQAILWCVTGLALAWPWTGLARLMDWGQRQPVRD
jgi:exo-beta-1,3-glucanase (GH17 family)